MRILQKSANPEGHPNELCLRPQEMTCGPLACARYPASMTEESSSHHSPLLFFQVLYALRSTGFPYSCTKNCQSARKTKCDLCTLDCHVTHAIPSRVEKRGLGVGECKCGLQYVAAANEAVEVEAWGLMTASPGDKLVGTPVLG